MKGLWTAKEGKENAQPPQLHCFSPNAQHCDGSYEVFAAGRTSVKQIKMLAMIAMG